MLTITAKRGPVTLSTPPLSLRELTRHKLPTPKGTSGRHRWRSGHLLTTPGSDEMLLAVIYVEAFDDNADGEIDGSEIVCSALVGNTLYTAPQDVNDYDVALAWNDQVLDVSPLRSNPGSPCVLRVGMPTYRPGVGLKGEVIASLGEMSEHPAVLNSLANATVQDALENTHAGGTADIDIGLMPVQAALVLLPQERERLIRELVNRASIEALRPSHFFVLSESSVRPYDPATDPGDIWEGGPSTKRMKDGDPYGWTKISGENNRFKAGDPEHFSRVTDELWLLAKATGDAVAVDLLTAACNMIRSPGWAHWNVGPASVPPKRPNFARMWGWVMRGFVQQYDLHRDYSLGLIQDIGRQLLMMEESMGDAFGVPYGIPSKALGDHAPPTVEQLRFYWTEWPHGPKRAWDPSWDNLGSAWGMISGGPFRKALEQAGEEDHGTPKAYIEGPITATTPDAPHYGGGGHLDTRVFGVGVLQAFAHVCTWQHVICLMPVLELAARDPARFPSATRIAKHLARVVMFATTGGSGVMPPAETESVTAHRDAQVRMKRYGKEPKPFETLDGYIAEGLARSLRVIPPASHFLRSKVSAAVNYITSGSKGAQFDDLERTPSVFADALRHTYSEEP